MFLILLFSCLHLRVADSACYLCGSTCNDFNPVSGTFGSVCTTITVTVLNGTTIYKPSAECGNNYVCNYDNSFCNGNSVPVCTLTTGASTSPSSSLWNHPVGLPCNTSSGCTVASNNYFCAQLYDQTTRDALYTSWYIVSNKFSSTNNRQVNFSSGGIYPTFTGVCVAATPPNLLGNPYASAKAMCGSHNDCKYQAYNGATQQVGGNNVANYMCYAGSTQCRQAASCHPVTHQCEAPSAAERAAGYTFFNDGCASCATAGCPGTNCAADSTGACCSQEKTCSNGYFNAGTTYPCHN